MLIFMTAELQIRQDEGAAKAAGREKTGGLFGYTEKAGIFARG
jgi:hypothetical protein